MCLQDRSGLALSCLVLLRLGLGLGYGLARLGKVKFGLPQPFMCNPNPNPKMDFLNPYPARHFLCFVKAWLILIDNLFSRNVWTVTVKGARKS